jgi:hypothetical protein
MTQERGERETIKEAVVHLTGNTTRHFRFPAAPVQAGSSNERKSWKRDTDKKDGRGIRQHYLRSLITYRCCEVDRDLESLKPEVD